MKVAITIEITDKQRNVLANLGATKRHKKLASRPDVRDFIAGCIAGLTEKLLSHQVPESPKPKVNEGTYDLGNGETVTVKNGPNVNDNYVLAFVEKLTDKEREVYEKLKKEGHCDNYIRGYFYVERARIHKAALKDS